MPIVPLVGSQEVGNPVRLMIGDNDSTNQEFSDSDLIYLLSRAVSYYQRYRPYALESTISLVANQKDYALPSDCLRPIDIPYRVFAGLDSTVMVAYLNAVYGSALLVPYKDWSDDVMNKIRMEFSLRFEALGAGTVEVNDNLTSYGIGQYLRLFPTPTASGGSFVLRYEANHPVQSNNYFTIPSYHAVWIQKLLEAEVYESRAAKMANTATSLGAGTTKMDFSPAMKQNYALAQARRQEFMDVFGKPVGMIG